MSDPIRTPDDEIERPGYFYPPFREGWGYMGATYRGHNNFSVDWNRRTPSGGYIEDLGHPVLAIADGEVSEVDKGDGLVMLDHAGGYQSEYRHMRNIGVKVGDRVERGDKIGEIASVRGDGRSTGPHLHHVHWKDGKRTQQRFYGEPVRTSVATSDTKPEGWAAPTPVYLVGPPPKATWQSAFRESEKRRERAEERIAAKNSAIALLTEEARLAKAAADGLSTELIEARRLLTECQNRPALDAQTEALLSALVPLGVTSAEDLSMFVGTLTDRAIEAEDTVLAVKRAVGCA
jgi:hypothetical protein